MDGLARPAGSGLPITICGETVILEGLRLRDFGVVEQHLLSLRVNPITEAGKATIKMMEDADLRAEQILREAEEYITSRNLKDDEAKATRQRADKRAADHLDRAMLQCEELRNRGFEEAKNNKTVSAQEVHAFLDTPLGLAFTVWLKLGQTYPGKFKLEDIQDTVQSLGEEEFQKLLADRDQASGIDIRGNSTSPQ